MNTTSTSTGVALLASIAIGGVVLWALQRRGVLHPVGFSDKAGMTEAIGEASRLHERWKQAGSTSP